MNNGKGNLRMAFLGVVVIASTVLGIFLLYNAGELVYQWAFRKKIRIEYFAKRLSSEVRRMNTVIKSAQSTPDDLATIFEFHKTSEAEIKILLQSVLFNNDELYGCGVFFEPFKYDKDSLYYSAYTYRSNDSLAYVDLNGPEYNYFYKDWYLIPKTLNQPMWSEPYFDEGGGNKLMSTYSVPFHEFMSNEEKFIGVLGIDVSIDWLADAVGSVGSMLKSRAALISENGTILSAPNRDVIYNETIFSAADERNLPILREIGKELQQGKTGYKIGIEGGQVIYIFYSVVPVTRWGYVLFVSEDELMGIPVTTVKNLL
jgi:phosphoserine phosphatase RsbU/P